jgi:hypothetical protein
MHNENHKVSKKEFEKDTKICSWISRIHIMKMAIILKATYRFNVITVTMTMSFLTKIEKSIYMEARKTLNSQSISEEKEQCWSTTIAHFKLYKRVIVKRKKQGSSIKTEMQTKGIE